MMKAIRMLALAAAMSGAAACSGDQTGVLVTGASSCASLSGTFNATSFRATSTADTVVTSNLLGGGGAFGLNFSGGNFTSIFTGSAGASPITQTSAYTLAGGNITLGTQTLFTGGTAGTQLFSCSLIGNTLTLTATNTNFMFPGTSAAQPANISITLTRSTTP